MMAMTGSVAERDRGATPGGTDLLTVGVEEEFLLVDPHTGTAVPAVDLVLEQVPAELRGQVEREFQTSQIEIGSPPGLELASIRHSLGVLRAELADAAERAGVRLLAIGTGPVDGPVPPVVDKPRFDRMIERFRLLVPGPGNNGMHVHVGVPDPEIGVQVLNHVRPWLPILQAVTANSPFARGEDTGYASWRSVEWERWPSVAPTPYLDSHEHYGRLIRQLIASGVMLDEGMLYWYARLSAKYPTVEIRIGDVCPSVDDSVLVAALVRALVATAMTDLDEGRPAVNTDHHLLVAAHWRAAHDGLEGEGVDLTDGELRPAWELLDRLVDRVRPELTRHGDLDQVTDLLSGLRRHGSGAARQRAVFARTGRLVDVVTDVARQTRG
ncbi:YbdK family carboxylate-amine ligase [Micromonospora sp. PPF5-17]|uniref:Putative glutamate--cysteine ligase 2 n=2 Tax=Micromonosporaceae TaxID=28056 RepID=A0ABX9W962_9ACTN|nr:MULTISPECIES: glutamate--cysteine ligase [Micromonospora]NES16961.1 YbdK family carboxylate-amine ligase [Micromonospora sp. PPF5-17B]NES39420.1 YbdK family carboxylate-amine ligase [Micromonospora solifontis]NES58687.1 YbdK family carboxylate-amine ligase [Micromonospora sp. PPF5-6]RNL89016.1 YbdK family carboxylate-amine ligase [Micromonospora solifontis]